VIDPDDPGARASRTCAQLAREHDAFAVLAAVRARALIAQPSLQAPRTSSPFKLIGLEMTAHQLRHAFATELARVVDGNLLLVANVLGHDSVVTTQGYTRFIQGPERDAVRKMWSDAAYNTTSCSRSTSPPKRGDGTPHLHRPPSLTYPATARPWQAGQPR
jgi:hypothetical protein